MWADCQCGEEFGSEENQSNSLIARWYGLIDLEGKIYVEDCTCWHPRAQQIADWLSANRFQVAEYLRLEKIRLTELANKYPTVEG